MNIIFYLFIILLSSLILAKTVDVFISSTTKLSHKLGISGYTISFLLVALATSLPETVVGIASSIEGKGVLAYTNIIGSNIALMTLVIGLAILYGNGIRTHELYKSKDVYFSTIFSLITIAIAFDGSITRLEGLVLFTGYVLYAVAFYRKRTLAEIITEKFENINLPKEMLLFIASLVLLVLSSQAIVTGAVKLSELLNIDLGFIGATLIAVGTSLPEIVYTLALVRQRKQSEILGNVVGSVSVNSTFVLGITAIIAPIHFSSKGLSLVSYIFVFVVTLIFLGFTKTNRKVDKLEAIILLIIYAAFLALEYFIQTF